jgi:hypothetical protein
MLILLGGLAALAQEYRSTLSGRATDPQEAVVPQVKIEAVRLETGTRAATMTDATGQYVLPFLQPGAYRITATVAGFKRFIRENFPVSSNERLTLDIPLEVGQQAESVTVEASAPLLTTATASVGQVLGAKQVSAMPVNGRTPLVLAQLAFGVVPLRIAQMNRPFDAQGPSEFTMGGGSLQQDGKYGNEFLLDGVPNMTGNNRTAYNPPLDSVEEVKVEAFNVDAAYGHTAGGTVNVVTKGGTNTLHGTVYLFNQASRLNAADYFLKASGRSLAVSRYNQYGFNVSGPVMIPKVLDGRNRVFFHFSQERIRDLFVGPGFSTIPTAAQKGGDFSSLLRVGAQYQIYDPATGTSEGARVRRAPFPGNVIPPSRINGVARNLMQYYPEPNLAGQADGQNNFIAGVFGATRDTFDSYLGRLDVNISSTHKLTVNARQSVWFGYRGNPIGRADDDVTANRATNRINWGSTIDDVLTLSPTLVLNTRFNFTRFEEPRPNLSSGFDTTALGFPRALAAASPAPILPRIQFSRFTGFGDTGNEVKPWDNFQIFSTLNKVTGKHTLKAGADLRLGRESGIVYGFSNGSYNFGTEWTRGPLDSAAASPLGQDFAAFLLGLPTAGSFDINTNRTAQQGYYSLFVHDDYRVRPNVTLNLGLRYERDLPTIERFDRSVAGFDSTTANPISAAAIAAYGRNPIPEVAAGNFRAPGGLLFAGQRGGKDLYDTRGYFSPRAGVAWNVTRKTVLRGGFGLFYFPLGISGVIQTGFSQATLLVPTLDGFQSPAATLNNPFPNGILQPTGASRGLATFNGNAISFYNPKPENPYSARWNFNVQRELPGNAVMELGYMGNSGHGLLVDRDMNFIPSQFMSTSPSRDQRAIDFLSARVSNPFSGLVPGTSLEGTTIQRQQLLRPFPQFAGVTQRALNDGSSWYHSLQVRVEKRLSHGLSVLGNYMFSKLLEQRVWLNPQDARPTKMIADEDRPHRVVISGSYDLPFGRGKRFGGGSRALVDHLIGGWALNGIYTWMSGAPLNWGNVIYFGGDLNLQPRNLSNAFDTTRFNRVAAQQLASNIRTFSPRFGDLRVDPQRGLDTGLHKNTKITERVTFQLRWEWFNATNSPVFGGPGTNPTATNFGIIQSQANQPRRTQLAGRIIW